MLDPGRWSNQWRELPGVAVTHRPAQPAADVPVVPGAVRPAAAAVVPVRPGAVRAAPAPHPPPPPRIARSMEPAPWGTEDRTRLRQVLSGRYDAYARVVTRTLAEEPGLRAAGGGADLVTDLVALCAYAADRQSVNDVLRAGSEHPAGQYNLIARGATSGLRRLPTVIGPVYATSNAAPGTAYRAGDELVEPAFVDVGLTGGAGGPEAAVEYVIWSVSARRVDRFTPQAQPAATFPPGSRFAVLAVDDPATDGRLRVLLRDRAGERSQAAGRWDETLRLLRQSAVGTDGQRPATLGFPLGLDQSGNPFAEFTTGGSRA